MPHQCRALLSFVADVSLSIKPPHKRLKVTATADGQRLYFFKIVPAVMGNFQGRFEVGQDSAKLRLFAWPKPMGKDKTGLLLCAIAPETEDAAPLHLSGLASPDYPDWLQIRPQSSKPFWLAVEGLQVQQAGLYRLDNAAQFNPETNKLEMLAGAAPEYLEAIAPELLSQAPPPPYRQQQQTKATPAPKPAPKAAKPKPAPKAKPVPVAAPVARQRPRLKGRFAAVEIR